MNKRTVKTLSILSVAVLIILMLKLCGGDNASKQPEPVKDIPLSSSEKASSSSEELSSSSSEELSSSSEKKISYAPRKKAIIPEPEPPAKEEIREATLPPPVIYEDKIAKSDALEVKDYEPIDNGMANAAPSKGFCHNKKPLCILAFALSATSLGVGIWQNGKMQGNIDKANDIAGDADKYPLHSQEYVDKYAENGKAKDDAGSNKNMRNGFYIGSGVFGAAGMAFFFF